MVLCCSICSVLRDDDSLVPGNFRGMKCKMVAAFQDKLMCRSYADVCGALVLRH